MLTRFHPAVLKIGVHWLHWAMVMFNDPAQTDAI